MNLLDHVYAIQNLFNAGRIPEERRFSNELIRHLFELNRSAILKQQLNKNYGLLEFNYQLICLKMIKANYSECLDCLNLDITCKLWKSKVKLPNIINYKEGLAIKVTDIEGNVIPKINLLQNKLNKYSITKQDLFGWFISSGHLFVVSNKDENLFSDEWLINVEAILETPSEIENLESCNASTDICLPMSMSNYPLDASLTSVVYDLTLNMLRQSSYPKDNLNDANNNQPLPTNQRN